MCVDVCLLACFLAYLYEYNFVGHVSLIVVVVVVNVVLMRSDQDETLMRHTHSYAEQERGLCECFLAIVTHVVAVFIHIISYNFGRKSAIGGGVEMFCLCQHTLIAIASRHRIRTAQCDMQNIQSVGLHNQRRKSCLNEWCLYRHCEHILWTLQYILWLSFPLSLLLSSLCLSLKK